MLRTVGLALALSALALWGCATAVPAGAQRSLVGVWQGVITGREMANLSGLDYYNITLTISADGTWTAITQGQRWSGTVRAIGNGGVELDGPMRPGGPVVWLRLHPYGHDGLGGLVATDYLGHRVVPGVDLRRVHQ